MSLVRILGLLRAQGILYRRYMRIGKTVGGLMKVDAESLVVDKGRKQSAKWPKSMSVKTGLYLAIGKKFAIAP
jgi:hypothetical protein